MASIFEKVLAQVDKEKGLKISYGANLLPHGDADLHVMDASTNQVLKLDYKVSGRDIPIIRGRKWQRFIGPYPVGATVSLYAYDGSDAHCKIVVD